MTNTGPGSRFILLTKICFSQGTLSIETDRDGKGGFMLCLCFPFLLNPAPGRGKEASWIL